MTIFTWVSRGLFERHKLVFLSQLTFSLMKRGVVCEKGWNEDHLQFLIRASTKKMNKNPFLWLPNNAWGAIPSLLELDEFSKFTRDPSTTTPIGILS